MAHQLNCPHDAFMVRSDDRNEVMELAQTHASMQGHDMSDDDIQNAIEQS